MRRRRPGTGGRATLRQPSGCRRPCARPDSPLRMSPCVAQLVLPPQLVAQPRGPRSQERSLASGRWPGRKGMLPFHAAGAPARYSPLWRRASRALLAASPLPYGIAHRRWGFARATFGDPAHRHPANGLGRHAAAPSQSLPQRRAAGAPGGRSPMRGLGRRGRWPRRRPPRPPPPAAPRRGAPTREMKQLS